jgi:hypothetical protein
MSHGDWTEERGFSEMALIDSGGAAMREREDWSPPPLPKLVRPFGRTEKQEVTVHFSVMETHDGTPCDCIAHEVQEMTLKVGEAVILTHTCHDGRVDKITATIVGVDVPTVIEHGSVSRG